MTRVRTFMLVWALPCLAGCPTKDKYEPLPTVRLTAPTTDRTYTNGTVHITAALDPPLDLPIELRKDGAAFTTLVPPAYEYSWDTTKAVEASYVLTAEVAFSSGMATSAPLTIVVDRTPPTISRTPSPGAGDVMLRAPIQVAFSEPIVLSQSARRLSPCPATARSFRRMSRWIRKVRARRSGLGIRVRWRCPRRWSARSPGRSRIGLGIRPICRRATGS